MRHASGLLFALATTGLSAQLHIGPGQPYANIQAVAAVAQPGDTIYVHRAPIFYIYGEAQRPGPYRVERGMTVMQALAQGGGPPPRGSEY